MSESSGDITGLLSAASSGDRKAEQELLGLASASPQRTDRGRTDTTEVVLEAYAKLFRAKPVEWESRRHFYRYAAKAQKREGLHLKMELTDAMSLVSHSPEEFLILHDALGRLETADPELGCSERTVKRDWGAAWARLQTQLRTA